jgi:hypothetical protein
MQIGYFGIKFLRQHKCKEVCQLLQLNQSTPLVFVMERRDRVSEDKEHDGLDESATDESGAGND